MLHMARKVDSRWWLRMNKETSTLYAWWKQLTTYSDDVAVRKVFYWVVHWESDSVRNKFIEESSYKGEATARYFVTGILTINIYQYMSAVLVDLWSQVYAFILRPTTRAPHIIMLSATPSPLECSRSMIQTNQWWEDDHRTILSLYQTLLKRLFDAEFDGRRKQTKDEIKFDMQPVTL